MQIPSSNTADQLIKGILGICCLIAQSVRRLNHESDLDARGRHVTIKSDQSRTMLSPQMLGSAHHCKHPVMVYRQCFRIPDHLGSSCRRGDPGGDFRQKFQGSKMQQGSQISPKDPCSGRICSMRTFRCGWEISCLHSLERRRAERSELSVSLSFIKATNGPAPRLCKVRTLGEQLLAARQT